MTTSSCLRKVVSGESDGAFAGLARGVFRVLSVPYAACSSLLEIVKSGQGGVRVDVPVFSVGNLTVGGTGKTPLVAKLVSDLQAKGRRPVILSRGYAADESGKNDEARVLERTCPGVLHLQDKDRASKAVYASDACLGDVIVLDDGFQYHALHRDLNVCTLDATNPFGYDAVLPRGLLREPVSGLYRARPVVITRAELVDDAALEAIKTRVMEINPYAKIIVSEMALTQLAAVENGEIAASGSPADAMAGESVLVASGIGNSDAFRRGVARTGARVRADVEKGDHHAWTADDAKALAAQAVQLGVDRVVTTVKDAVKLAALPWPDDAPPLFAVDVEVRIREGEDLWNDLLDEVLKGS